MNLPMIAGIAMGGATVALAMTLRLQRPRWAYRTQQAARGKGDAGLGLIVDDLTPDELANLEPPTLHMGGCARCGGAQGDIATVHYRGLCAITHTLRPIHWCCPGNDCELTPPFPAVPTAEAVDNWTRQVMDLPTAEMAAVLVELDPPTSRPYIDGPVLLGRKTLHPRCLGARRDGTYGEICASCRPSLVGVARETPGGQP